MDKDSVKRLREQWGFVITDERDPDLLGWLFNAFLDDQQEKLAALPVGADTLAAAALLGIKSFIEFARTKLRDNPPMTMSYLPRGIALMLQNHQQIVLVEPAEDAAPNDSTQAGGAVPVTNFSRRGGGPPGHPQKSTDAPVTGTGRPKK